MRNFVLIWFVSWALSFSASPCAQTVTPNLSLNLGGDSALHFKPESLEEEQSLGRVVASQILGATKLLQNARLQRYVNLIGRRVADQTGRKDLNWTFGVLDSSALNAFASPGGYVLITSGLIQILETEDELAGVLAHEVAHVVRKHHYRVIRKQQLLEFGANSVAIGSDNNAMALKLSGMVAQIMARGLDRSAEFEADSDAMVYAARAGYDSSSLLRAMEKLSAISGKRESTQLLMSTHPTTTDRRIAMTQAVSEQLERSASLSAAAPRLMLQLRLTTD